MFFCTEIIAEYQDVLSRSYLNLNDKDIFDLLEAVITLGSIITPDKSDIFLPDEDDRVFYDTANFSNSYLVTGNIKHYPKDVFVKTPAQFMMLLSG